MAEPSLLSDKPIAPNERLIFALDVPGADAARAMVARLGDAVSFYKIGLQLFMSGGYFELIEHLKAQGKKVFVDLKFFDVPETVRLAVRALRDRGGADFCTVHGNDGILKAAASEKGDMKILAVTALTSLDRGDLQDLGFACDVEALVLSRARRALEHGCDGVISSGREARVLRTEIGPRLLIVTPGIRPVDNDSRPADDQKRTMALDEAFRAGADHVVVGRPIRDAADPRAAALEMQAQICAVFAR
ncbi:MAG: orotidine-5'-phosphate decarboxylase [Verrucomicrobiae bacterium]|nr:orotidine-5'-phosphate decarboxylase [Verrucomicrobiae bacterium]